MERRFPAYMFLNFDFMFSEFEGKFEDTNGSVPPACLPIASSSGSTENHDIEALAIDNTGTAIEHQVSHDHDHADAQPGDTSDLNYLQEQVGGMLKITPSDAEVSVFLLILRYSKKTIDWKTNNLSTVIFNPRTIIYQKNV